MLRAAFALFDVPEAIAVARAAMCTAEPLGGGGLQAITRVQVEKWYGEMLGGGGGLSCVL